VCQANPVVVDVTSLIAFCYVVLAAFLVEAGVVALLLTFRGLAPLRIFAAYFVANALVFFFVFEPLLGRRWLPVPVLEFLIVLIDALGIKLLVGLDTLQGEDFAGVSWSGAVVISGIGNLLSFLVGYIASQKPWIAS
jgi:hypothetical protein